MALRKKIVAPVRNLTQLIRSDKDQHIWEFSRVGGVNRVNLTSGLDIKSLRLLDQKLWTVLSCPVHGLEIDAKTLELIDIDNDNRIRVPEVLDAIDWIVARIKNGDELLQTNKSLPLSSINDETEEGKALLASAQQILINLGKAEQSEITVAETSDITAIFADTQFNGDAIITEASTENETLKQLIVDIIASMGSVLDRSGKEGINEELINQFYQNAEEYLAWQKIATENSTAILPFGNLTADALTAYQTVKSKIEDYFLRCQLAEYDNSSIPTLSTLTTQYEAINNKNLSTCIDEIEAFPIAKMNENKLLPLVEGVNPTWAKAMEKFQELVVVPLFKQQTHLTLSQWESIAPQFDAYHQWLSQKKGEAVEKLGLDALQNILTTNKKEELLSLVAQDKALENEANNILMVDKLARFYCDIHTLLKNYVNFSDFYSPENLAIFQAGKLFIDQRCCDLCIKVSDMPKHNTMAGVSGICLVYCNCVSRSKNETMTIVAALTDGDIDNITIGRNAIFYDRKGGDWDATIVKIIDNPISIRQAFWSPYVKLNRFISTQIEKVASSKEKEVTASTTSQAEKATQKVDGQITESVQAKPVSAPTPPAQPFDIGKFVGIFAAISLALSAIGSIILSVVTGFLKLVWWQMPLALLGLILIISLPSMVLAFLKLRKRNLAPVLDANGWAINARITINIVFGRTLTHLVALPENSKVNLIDPFKEKSNPWIPILIGVIALAVGALVLIWKLGML